MSTRINLWTIPGSYFYSLNIFSSSIDHRQRRGRYSVQYVLRGLIPFPLHFPSSNSSFHWPQSIIISFGQLPNSLEGDSLWNWYAIPWPLCSSHRQEERWADWKKKIEELLKWGGRKGRLWEETCNFRWLLPDVSPFVDFPKRRETHFCSAVLPEIARTWPGR